jgi:hypothetical protein
MLQSSKKTEAPKPAESTKRKSEPNAGAVARARSNEGKYANMKSGVEELAGTWDYRWWLTWQAQQVADQAAAAAERLIKKARKDDPDVRGMVTHGSWRSAWSLCRSQQQLP